MTVAIILDLIVVAIIIVSVIISAHYGFVRTAIEVAGLIAAVLLSNYISAPLSSFTYVKVIEPSIISATESASSEKTKETVDKVWSAMPKFVTKNSDSLGISKDNLSKEIADKTSEGVTNAAKKASETVAMPVITKILSMIYSTVIFVALFFVVKILAKYINKLFSVSVIGKVNKTFGGIIGFFKGILVAVAFCMVISLILSFTKNGFWFITKDAVNNSVLFKPLSSVLPFFR